MSTANEPANEPGVPEEPVESAEFTVEPDSTEPQETEAQRLERERAAEKQRLAREREAFDELVASFHSETAPDPEPRKIIRYPVLNQEPQWEPVVVEPTDELTVDPLDVIDIIAEPFEQPDPPLPETSAATRASWTLLVGGVLFLVAHTLFQWNTPEWLGWLAIIGICGGIVSLMVRMKPDRDDFDDPDNGAVV